jgi:hypothetical protein
MGGAGNARAGSLGSVCFTTAHHWENLLLSHDVGAMVAHNEAPEAKLQSEDCAEAPDRFVRVNPPKRRKARSPEDPR